jgi:hypothetical protein
MSLNELWRSALTYKLMDYRLASYTLSQLGSAAAFFYGTDVDS